MPPRNAPQPTEEANFGAFVATDGQTILVTVSHGPAAYTYGRREPGRKWIYEAALAPADGTTSFSGAMRGDVAVVGGATGVGWAQRTTGNSTALALLPPSEMLCVAFR
jgi:hypothetical protein